MTEENVRSGLGADGVKDVSGAVQDLVGNVASILTKNDKPRAMGEKDTEPPAAEPRLFFPNGIELIDATVRVGPVNIHVEVAGAKGVSPKTELGLKPQHNGSSMDNFDGNSFVCDHDITVSDDGVGNPGFQIIWHNREPQDLMVAFDIDGCPLDNSGGDCNGFTVPGNGGEYPTTVVGPKNTYHYNVYFAQGFRVRSGNSKVIIQ